MRAVLWLQWLGKIEVKEIWFKRVRIGRISFEVGVSRDTNVCRWNLKNIFPKAYSVNNLSKSGADPTDKIIRMC